MEIKCISFHHESRLPKKAYSTDAAFDVFAVERVTVGARSTPVSLGLAFEVPEGYYLKLEGRSGLGKDFGLRVDGLICNGEIRLAGIIDCHFRGEVQALLSTLPAMGNKTFIPGDKVCQMTIHEVIPAVFGWAPEGRLTSTDRGQSGFGSTDALPMPPKGYHGELPMQMDFIHSLDQNEPVPGPDRIVSVYLEWMNQAPERRAAYLYWWSEIMIRIKTDQAPVMARVGTIVPDIPDAPKADQDRFRAALGDLGDLTPVQERRIELTRRLTSRLISRQEVIELAGLLTETADEFPVSKSQPRPRHPLSRPASTPEEWSEFKSWAESNFGVYGQEHPGKVPELNLSGFFGTSGKGSGMPVDASTSSGRVETRSAVIGRFDVQDVPEWVSDVAKNIVNSYDEIRESSEELGLERPYSYIVQEVGTIILDCLETSKVPEKGSERSLDASDDMGTSDLSSKSDQSSGVILDDPEGGSSDAN